MYHHTHSHVCICTCMSGTARIPKAQDALHHDFAGVLTPRSITTPHRGCYPNLNLPVYLHWCRHERKEEFTYKKTCGKDYTVPRMCCDFCTRNMISYAGTPQPVPPSPLRPTPIPSRWCWLYVGHGKKRRMTSKRPNPALSPSPLPLPRSSFLLGSGASSITQNSF